MLEYVITHAGSEYTASYKTGVMSTTESFYQDHAWELTAQASTALDVR